MQEYTAPAPSAPPPGPPAVSTIPFCVTLVHVASGSATKRLVDDGHGQPIRDPDSGLWIRTGRVTTLELQGLSELSTPITSMKKRQAMVHGIVKGSKSGDVFRLVTTEKHSGEPGTVTRSLEFFAYPEPYHLLMLDYDHWPACGLQAESASDLLNQMTPAIPHARSLGYLRTHSTSSSIRPKKQPDTWLVAPSGMHVYLVCTGDVARFRELVKVRLWNAGLGYCRLATANVATGVAGILERALIDLTVFSPERLDYCAGADIPRDAAFYQDLPPPELHDGNVLDLDALPDITPEERREYDQRLEEAKERLRLTQRQQVRVVLQEQLAACDEETQEAEVTLRLDRASRGELAPDHVLYFPAKAITARELATHAGKAFDNRRLRDPVEPTYGPSQAVFHWREGDWLINSWAHGLLKTYRLACLAATPPDDDDMAHLLSQGDHQHSASPSPVRLLLNKNGTARAVLANALAVLEADARWQHALAYNVFADEVVFVQRPPYLDGPAPWVPRPVRDEDDGETANWLQRHYGVFVASAVAAEAIRIMAARAPFHPVRNYLGDLTWDGVPRLDMWLTSYCGASDCAYVRAVAAMTLIGAVARVQAPGAKVDTVSVLEGSQGAFKSTAWRILASDLWFSDSLTDMHNKDAMQMLRGVWFVELGELAALQRGEVESIKRYISATQDHYRPSYGRRAVTYPRQNIFVGSTNLHEYLKDTTGSRRFWPVTITRCNVEALQRDRDQLWAEATQRYRQGEAWHLAADLEAVAAGEQELRVEHDPWEESILKFVASHAGSKHVTTRQILEGALNISNAVYWTSMNSRRVATILRRHGWRPSRPRDTTGKTYSAFFKDLKTPEPSATYATAPSLPTSGDETPHQPSSAMYATAATSSLYISSEKNHTSMDMGEKEEEKERERNASIYIEDHPHAPEACVATRATTEGNGISPSRSSRSTADTAMDTPPSISPIRCPKDRGTHAWIRRSGQPRLCAKCNAEEQAP